MKSYSPFHSAPEESERLPELFEGIAKMDVSDTTLVEYVKTYIVAFRRTVEEFFPRLAAFIRFYRLYPFHTTVVRLGPNGVFIVHRPDRSPEVEVRRFQDFDPPFESPNIYDIMKR